MSAHRRTRRTSFGPALALSSALALGLAVIAPASSSWADAVDAPTGVDVTFVAWHDGTDRMQVTWDAPVDPVDHYEVVASGGTAATDPDVTVGGDQTGVALDVPTAANAALSDQLSFTVYAWSDDSTRSDASDPATIDSVLGATLTGGTVSGVAHTATLSWTAPDDGDQLLLFRADDDGDDDPFATGTPVTIPDDTAAGSITVNTGSSTQTPQYALYEQVIGDPEQRSPASLAVGAAAPNPVTNVDASYSSDGTSLDIAWGLPAGCPSAYWLTHCMNVRAVVKEGKVAPTSPSDGLAVSPTLDQAGVEHDSTQVTGLQPGHTYSLAVFNTPYASLDVYSPAVTDSALVDKLTPDLTFTGTIPTTVTYGTAVTLRAAATQAFDGSPVQGLVATLTGSNNANSPGVIAHGSTNSAGVFSATFVPSVSASYEVSTDPSQRYWGVANDPQDPLIQVKPLLSIDVSDSTVKSGTTITFTGVINPQRVSTIKLQALDDTGWHTVTTTTCGTTGAYSLRLRTSDKGTTSYRVARSADSLLAVGISPTQKVTVS